MITVYFYDTVEPTRTEVGRQIFLSIDAYWEFYQGKTTRLFKNAKYGRVDAPENLGIDGTEFNWA